MNALKGEYNEGVFQTKKLIYISIILNIVFHFSSISLALYILIMFCLIIELYFQIVGSMVKTNTLALMLYG